MKLNDHSDSTGILLVVFFGTAYKRIKDLSINELAHLGVACKIRFIE